MEEPMPEVGSQNSAGAAETATAAPPSGNPAAPTLGDPAAKTSNPASAADLAARPAVGQPANVLERLERALENLVVLRAVTVVGNITANGADEFNQVTGLRLEPDTQQVCSTSVNMLLGDCSLILSPIFVENAAYKQLHDDSVKQALAVRQQTIDLLKQAFDAFKDKLFR
jgi:hypothetical protein